jgi:BlaI family penicillinase repressor
VYLPARPQKQVIGSMVREFVQRVFNGSAEPLLAHLVEDEQLTGRDLDEIRKTIHASRKSGGRAK